MTTPCTARNTWAISPQQLSKFTQILLSSHHLECTATSISISISSLRTLLLLTLPETYGTTLLPSSHCAASASYHNYSQYGTYSYYLIISLQPVLLHQELICHLLSTNPQYYHVSSARNHHHQQHSPHCLPEEEPV